MAQKYTQESHRLVWADAEVLFDEEITIYKNHFFTGYAGAPVLKNKATMHVQQVTSSHCSRILGGHYSVVRYNLVDQQRTRETSG